MSVRTRFAPSPTGYLHIGGVRTALFNWLLAKQAGGQFLLRIDDTDAERNVAEALLPILSGFEWLGIDWDEGPSLDGKSSNGPYGPYFQSQRLEYYQAAAKRLVESGHAYRDYAKPEELAEQRLTAEKEGKTFIYDRRWMAATDEQAAEFEAQGRSGVVRLKMPRQGVCEFHDLVRGPVEFEWAAEQDHVVQRADGTCLYHLASVVDDFEMKITHVVRAVEHLSNTPRQIFIAQSLGYELPVYAHLPFVAEPGGSAKLSKRKLAAYLKNKDFAALFELGQRIAKQTGLSTSLETFNPVIVDFYQTVGFLPDAILNYLVLLGWSFDDSREEFTRDEMIKLFNLDRVNKAPASFDPAKLLAFQSRWMNSVALDRKVQLCLPYLQSAGLVGEKPSADVLDRIKHIVTAAGDRIKVSGDILDFDDFFTADDKLVFNALDVDKRMRGDAAAVEYLKKFREALAILPGFDAAALEQCLTSFMESEGIKFKQIVHALRVAVTGKSVGFGMFDAMAILGRTSCLSRIDRALELIKNA
jgi:glutamyl-tRNA synthetase